jgi:hypothetical protein
VIVAQARRAGQIKAVPTTRIPIQPSVMLSKDVAAAGVQFVF